MKFQRMIGPVGLLFAGISSVIGSGWLFGPLFAAQIAGPGAILTWMLGGCLMVIIALTFAELGSTFPVAGGMIQFAQYSHGPLLSFLIGWMVWISSVAVAPVETMGLLQYAGNYLPVLVTKVDNVRVLTSTGIVAAIWLMFFMCLLNYFGAKFFSRSNTIITVVKLIVPIATLVILFTVDFHSINFTNPATGGFLPYGWHGVVAALPLGGVIYSFIGSNTVLQLAGETQNPQRAIPLALIGSMLFCIVLYALLQTAFIGALMPEALKSGWAHLHFQGDSGPFAGIIAALGIAWFVIVIYADALISPFGTAFVFTASTARVTYGLSEIGFFPKGLKKLSANGVPLLSLTLNYFVGLLLFFPFPAWQKLVSFIISCFIVSYIVGPISLLALRKSQPDKHRPFKLPFAPGIAFVAFYICNLLIFWTGWETVSKMMLVMLVGIIFFMLHSWRMKTGNILSQWRIAWWLLPYFGLMTLISWYGSFGGGSGLLPFGWDFLVVGLLTLAVYLVTPFTKAVN